MSIEVAYRIRQDAPHSFLRDLDRVALIAAVRSDEGIEVPAGAEGTIVSVYKGGESYVVEFPTPPGTLADVEPQHLRLIEHISS